MCLFWYAWCGRITAYLQMTLLHILLFSIVLCLNVWFFLFSMVYYILLFGLHLTLAISVSYYLISRIARLLVFFRKFMPYASYVPQWIMSFRNRLFLTASGM
jgi:hypothetical protein